MPQLDPVTFLSQFFWLCFFFFGFYFLICKDFLPKMGRILKFRRKKMNLSAEGMQGMKQENEKVRASSKTLVENGLNSSSNLWVSQLHHIESWLTRIIAETNKKQLQDTNELYIGWIGDNSIRQQIALQAAAPLSTPRIFASILMEKCKKKVAQIGKPSQFAKQSTHFGESRADSLDHVLSEKKKGGAIEGTQMGKSRASKK